MKSVSQTTCMCRSLGQLFKPSYNVAQYLKQSKREYCEEIMTKYILSIIKTEQTSSKIRLVRN